MPLMTKEPEQRDFKRLPSGIHFAVCIQVIDLGWQEGYGGKLQRKAYLRFEVPDERVEYDFDGKHIEGPCSIGKEYTLSLGEKANLRKDLENWRGALFTETELKGFDLFTVLGKCCQIQVQQYTKTNGKLGDKITGIVAYSKDQRERAKTIKPENPLIAFDIDNPTNLQDVPLWLQEKIADARDAPGTPESSSATLLGGDDSDPDDDIPF